VLAPQGPLGDAVAERLRDAGAAAVMVEPGERFQRLSNSHFTARPGELKDISAIVTDVGRDTGAVEGAMYLWATGGADWGDGTPILLSYDALVALAAGLDVSPAAPVRVVVATAGAESVLDELVCNPESALILGPVLALPTEVPGLHMRAVDLARVGSAPEPGTSARALVEEAALKDGEYLVARRAGRRWVRRFERIALPPADETTLPLKSRGVYLITGGTGGIGLTLARWLAARFAARLVLTSRKALPPRQAWDAWLSEHGSTDRTASAIRAILDIEQLGGEVTVAAADAADPDAMQRVIEEVRERWGALDGVIHAAGISGSGAIALGKQPDDVRAVVAPKVGGLSVLVRLLGDTPLDFLALISSNNSFFGIPGVSDYAGANAVLDAFVDSEARPLAWRHVVALDFEAWRDVGMAANLVVPEARRAQREAFLSQAIPPAAGAEAFARILASKRRRVAVIPYDLVRLDEDIRAHFSGASAVTEQASASSSAGVARETGSGNATPSRPNLSSAFAPPETEIERRVAAIWTELLGIDGIGIHDDFFELGGHSLLATRVLARVDDACGVRLALRDVFDAPTIHRLAERIAAVAPGSAGAAQSSDDDREEIEI
jgi:NAD(P)-dependent dehydrogenase (short-subunit alcohol dehydrogenase family)